MTRKENAKRHAKIQANGNFGERVLNLRIKKDWDQRTLGREVGYSDSMISAVEKGRRNPGTRLMAKLKQLLEAEGL